MAGKRAAHALSTIAAGELWLVTWMMVIAVLRERTYTELRSGPADYEVLKAKLALYSKLSFGSHLLGAALVLVALAVLFGALRRGRGLALAAGLAMLAHLGLAVVNRLMGPQSELGFGVKALWWVNGALASLGLTLPLVAAARALPSSFAKLGAIGALAMLAIDAGLSAYGFGVEDYPGWLAWLERGLAVTGAIWFASFALPIASRWRRGDAGEGPARGGVLDGTPLRVLAWALLARIGLGAALQVLVLLSMANGEYESAGTLTALGTLVSVIVSLIVLGALVAYLRFPESHRGSAIPAAMGLLLVGAGFDLYATNAASELFAMVGSARRATSFWAMPSLSKMQELQTTLAWGGRAALACGIGAGLALASSLLATARAVGTTAQVEQASRVMTLLVIGGLGSIVASFLTGERDLVIPLLLLALGMLGVAITLLVTWMRLLFGLATALETPPAEP